MKSEAEIKKAIKNWLDKHDCFHFPYNPYMTKAGMPDRIVTIQNGVNTNAIDEMLQDPRIVIIPTCIVIALEVKSEKGKVTKLQLAVHKELRAAGWIVGVVRSVDDVKKLFAKYGINLIKK